MDGVRVFIFLGGFVYLFCKGWHMAWSPVEGFFFFRKSSVLFIFYVTVQSFCVYIPTRICSDLFWFISNQYVPRPQNISQFVGSPEPQASSAKRSFSTGRPWFLELFPGGPGMSVVKDCENGTHDRCDRFRNSIWNIWWCLCLRPYRPFLVPFLHCFCHFLCVCVFISCCFVFCAAVLFGSCF